jgi:hypothetical protein
MAAKIHNFSIEQGSSFRLSLTYKGDNGSPLDLTGYCARLVMKTNSGNEKVFTSGTTNSEYKFTIDAPQGVLTLLISSNTTNGYDFSSAKYDLELQTPQDLYVGGGKYTLRILYGTINIIKRFSQNTTALEC